MILGVVEGMLVRIRCVVRSYVAGLEESFVVGGMAGVCVM